MWAFKAEEVVKAAPNRTNTIVVQPTGNSKSLCYQFLPFATGGTAVVISPTLSLIHDQVEELCAKGITATYLCSTQNDTSIPAAISRGEFKVVYITPERMFPGGGCEPNPLFLSLASRGKLCLVAIDEAHCVFSWQSFRYVLKYRLPVYNLQVSNDSYLMCKPYSYVVFL